MQNPELTPEGTPDASKRTVPSPVQQGETKADVNAVLRFGTIEDPTDRALVIAAAAFVESPTDSLAEIDSHMRNVSEVLTGYMMTGADAPPEVDALHADLLELFCQHHINAARTELSKEAPDMAALDLAMRMALDSAKNLSKGYQRPSYLAEVTSLETRVSEVKGS